MQGNSTSIGARCNKVSSFFADICCISIATRQQKGERVIKQTQVNEKYDVAFSLICTNVNEIIIQNNLKTVFKKNPFRPTCQR